MKKEKLVILIGFMPDPRMFNRADAESERYEVHFICWDRGSNMIPRKDKGNYAIHTIKLPASNQPLKRLIPYAKFRREALKLLNEIQPTAIHAQMIDMLKIAVKYADSRKEKVNLIYEIADLHRLLVDKQKNPVFKAAQMYLRHEDRRCTNDIDILILTSKRYYGMYFSDFIPKEKVLYLPNVPDLSAFRDYKKHDGRGEDFTVGYIGGIRYKDQCRILVEAAKRLDMPLLFAGFENGEPEIENLCKSYENGTWVGGFDFNTQIAQLYSRCDVIYSVYNADMANVRVALPNKLYESVYCGLPIIVAKNTHLADTVAEWGVGEAVDHKHPEELTQVLERMRDDRDYYDSFVENCSDHADEVDLRIYSGEFKKRLAKM